MKSELLARRAIALITLALVSVAACSNGPGSSGSPRPKVNAAWSKALRQVGKKGEVSLQTAQQAFAVAFGTSSAQSPASRGLIPSGTAAIRWLLGHETELTPEQIANVRRVAPAFVGPKAAALPPPDGIQLVGATSLTAVINAARVDIAAEIGQALKLETPVDFDDKNVRHVADDVLAYTVPVNAAGDTVGTAAKCPIYVRPALMRLGDAQIRAGLYHEVWHCFQAQMSPSLEAFYKGPSWVVEGEAEWVSATLAPGGTVSPGWWEDYLSQPQDPLFGRTYDAIGFYAHMSDIGLDPWSRLEQILLAAEVSGSEAAFATAIKGSSDTFLNSWASGVARRPDLGRSWDTRGPGIPSTRYDWDKDSIVNGSSLGWLSADAYANNVREYDLNAEVVYLGAQTDHARLHGLKFSQELQAGELRGAYYCVAANPCQCPKGTELEGQQIPKFGAGPALLAVSGGESGNSVTVNGLSLQEYCKEKTKLDPCVVGTWRSPSLAGVTIGRVQIVSGGEGIVLTVARDGTSVFDFSGFTPMEMKVGEQTGTGTIQGVSHQTLSTSGGMISASNYDGAGVVINTVVHVDGIDVPFTFPFGGLMPATTSQPYLCGRSSLTFVQPAPYPDLVYTRG